MKIKNPVKLKFDPEKSKNPVTKEIFNDYIARIFWLGIKSTHYIKKGFGNRCLFISSQISNGFEINSHEDLEKIINLFMKEFIKKPKHSANGMIGYDKDLIPELYHYLKNEELEYIVNSKK